MKTTLLLLLLAAPAAHANTHCMPAALDFAARDFEDARAGGLVAYDLENNPVNLGTDAEAGPVTIEDVHKNSYRIYIHVNSNGVSYVLSTYVSVKSYDSCAINMKSGIPHYLLAKE